MEFSTKALSIWICVLEQVLMCVTFLQYPVIMDPGQLANVLDVESKLNRNWYYFDNSSMSSQIPKDQIVMEAA